MLEEIDGSRLAGTFAGNRLKKFHPRQRLQLNHVPVQGDEEILILQEFITSDSDSNLSDAPSELSHVADDFFDYRPSFFTALRLRSKVSWDDLQDWFSVFVFVFYCFFSWCHGTKLQSKGMNMIG